MNIIFGTEMAIQAQERYTVLELDTFNLLPTDKTITAYCLVEQIPLTELPCVGNNKELHQNLITEYKKRNWQYSEDVIEYLRGKWGGEADSFYTELHQRIQQLRSQELPQDWTGRLDKTVEVV